MVPRAALTAAGLAIGAHTPMTDRTVSLPILHTLGGARGAAASLGKIAITAAEIADQVPGDAPPELLNQTAATLQAMSQRAMLAVLSCTAHAARLEAFALCQAAEALRRETERQLAIG